MIAFLFWYLAATLIGLASFPLAYRLLPALPDRGYALSRVLGLLLWGYGFWLLSSLGVLRNNPGGLVFSLLCVLILSFWAARGIDWGDFSDWFNARHTLVWSVEAIFFISFAGWTLVRATNPEIWGTEKPMELAFINAIMNSSAFPPHDPWLSGYAISYYYFGYVLVGMLAKITIVPATVAFNLGLALVFALSAIGAYSLVFNLLVISSGGREALINRASINARISNQQLRPALLGPFFVLIVSNLEGFLEILHAGGVFSSPRTSALWKWLDIPDINQPQTPPFSWLPRLFGTGEWWWWRASRVVQDYDLMGLSKGDVIDEFPFFSFLLADLHPHVLAMPFAFLAITLALNVFYGGGEGQFNWMGLRQNMNRQTFILAALVLGGLAFLNTWDFPIYVALFCSVFVIGQVRANSLERSLLSEFLSTAFALTISGVGLYIPFYLGFSSQAGGVLPNLIYPTRGAHLWIMFGALLVPIAAYLLYLWRRQEDWGRLRTGFGLAVGLAFVLWIFSLLLGLGISQLPTLGDLFLSSLGAQGNQTLLFQSAIDRRLTSSGGWVTTVVFLGVTLGLLLPESTKKRTERLVTMTVPSQGVSTTCDMNPAHAFTVLVVFFGTLLVLGPEFFYLRDQFGYRINTIFKFYFQAWLLWGIAAAFGTAIMLKEMRTIWSIGYRSIMLVVVAMSLFYPVLALWDKTHGFKPPQGFTLDGGAYLARQSPDEVAGIQWLRRAHPGVVVEAIGDSYSNYARVATYSGQPTVLGWPGHESQWRGGGEEMGSRRYDVERIYRSSDSSEVLNLLHRYDVRYVFLGPLERSSYGAQESRFNLFLKQVFKQGQVYIFEVPGLVLRDNINNSGSRSIWSTH